MGRYLIPVRGEMFGPLLTRREGAAAGRKRADLLPAEQRADCG